ncbi:MAG: aspartate 1-decarboxylase [Candidatus Rifleibacteriota bacterium]
MNIHVLKSKIHRAVVTGADLNYEGSISICPELLKASRMYLSEKVDIYNVNNGQRFSTYIIEGKPGQICLNGAAARLVHKGDPVIIVSYGIIAESEIESHKPVVVLVDEKNKIKKVM